MKLFIIFLLFLPLFSGGRTELKAKQDIVAKLTNINKIDVCGNKTSKEILLVLDIGKVYYSDSLFAFNFELKYDTSKVKITSALYLNTLAEFFDDKIVSFPKGMVRGAVYVCGTCQQVAGERPLIAFGGEYLDNCEDTSIVDISYIEFTDEFQKNIIEYKSAIVIGEVEDKADRFLKIALNSNKFENLEKDSTVDVKIKLQYNISAKLKSANIKLFFDKKSIFDVTEITSINKNVIIDSIIRSDSDILIKTRIMDTVQNKDILKVTVVQKENQTDSVNIKIDIEDINDCSCITRINESAVFISGKWKQNDTASVVIEKNNFERSYSYYENNEFVIINGQELIRSIKVYDLSGSLVRFMSG
ncbi:MAG: hypothetical protein Q8M94_09520, partial [Ignavibacteria bacterium]|nr:hypothetical protein [Ignavibacteria bacterium]